jgi:hypothetical protein
MTREGGRRGDAGTRRHRDNASSYPRASPRPRVSLRRVSRLCVSFGAIMLEEALLDRLIDESGR